MKSSRGLLLLMILFNFPLAVFAKNFQDPHLIVHYWSHHGSPFGHISIEVKNAQNESVYLSYMMGNNLKNNLEILGSSAKVKLPLLNDDAFDTYKAWWKSGPFWHLNTNYGKDYRFLTFNCAHAVSNALKFLGYDTKLSDHHFALRPKQVWKKVKKFIKPLERSQTIYPNFYDNV